MGDTRRRLIDGVIGTIRAHGITAVSARTIAATAGVNQALVFYHFDSVDNLLAQACLVTTEERVARFRERFAEVDSFSGLLALGARLHEDEREAGNVTVLAQMLAGAQRDPKLAEATGAAVQLWITEIEHVLRRLLAGSPLEDLLDPTTLARTVAATFVGLELFEPVTPIGSTLDELAKLVEVVDDLGPVARRVVRAKLRNTVKKERA
ncbi:TetR/AcrR family transcriptional regulator [Allokutzneria sp. A3M-2-11 16]|uniref:TetR/AcrR family transcriptional regulator n=1 Tax=Allokutzneria sp. A3M-2-11 16 TaxID=2962043 RepID=UPI0020B86C30|nr:TetR/AcrR family transcriptional regulator [Allokutzneria sp. A3M-2-11 16]MCP3802459.1 TetR/AcrR family transcriptional regulator [Allokutzneria sp. A3M-2-11 16]